jgi:hypothetical protein
MRKKTEFGKTGEPDRCCVERATSENKKELKGNRATSVGNKKELQAIRVVLKCV